MAAIQFVIPDRYWFRADKPVQHQNDCCIPLKPTNKSETDVITVIQL